jgi:hypothetical protein
MVNNASNTFTGFKGFGNQSEKKGSYTALSLSRYSL